MAESSEPSDLPNWNPWSRRPRLKAVLFDFDGTLTKPGQLDFAVIKEQVGCPTDRPVLEYIQGLPEAEQKEAFEKLERFELEAAERAEPNDSASEVVKFLRSRALRVGVLSRNGQKSILRSLANFADLNPENFDVIISRDEPVAPKPDPEGVLEAARRMDVSPEELIVVGDYVFDVQAGRRAGAVTALLRTTQAEDYIEPESDFTISSLSEVSSLLRPVLPLDTGKVPNDLLADILKGIVIEDEQVLNRPAVGEDAVAVDVSSADVLVLKADPITFVTDSIGLYSVMVNANDIATSGATPRWMLTTLLMPRGTTPVEVRGVVQDIDEVCRKIGVSLCGGHTEITDAVNRTVASGMMSGTVPPGRLIDKRDITAGDRIFITKAAAVEGTSILAREFAPRLREKGFTEAELEDCRALVAELSVLDEARIATKLPFVTGMHDVTEGGVATALRELSVASGHGLCVNLDAIPILPVCERMCCALGLDPLGLIGSGSLLICCNSEGHRKLVDSVNRAGVPIACIGEVIGKNEPIQAHRSGTQAGMPAFEVDELARLYTMDV